VYDIYNKINKLCYTNWDINHDIALRWSHYTTKPPATVAVSKGGTVGRLTPICIRFFQLVAFSNIKRV